MAEASGMHFKIIVYIRVKLEHQPQTILNHNPTLLSFTSEYGSAANDMWIACRAAIEPSPVSAGKARVTRNIVDLEFR